MIKPIDYLLLRWRLVVALLGGILAAMVMLFFALSGQSGAQTPALEPGQHVIAGGENHSLAVRKDGHVFAWGGNAYGQLGVNSDNPHHTPVQVHGVGNVGYLGDGTQSPPTAPIVDVAAGYHHSLAVSNDGTVYAWGGNSYGQLGDGTTHDRDYPVRLYGITDVVAVAAGYHHSLALKSDGTVWAWGGNDHGQLGTNNTERRLSPTPVYTGSGLTGDVTDLAAGDYYSLTLMKDSSANTTVWAWGENSDGQLGVNSNNDHAYPVQVHGLSNQGYLGDVEDVEAGNVHSLAVKSDNSVWAWGSNFYGQLGDGTFGTGQDRHTPVQVHGPNNGQPPTDGLSGITDVAAGNHHSLAVGNDGTAAWAWGGNNNGQLGDDSNDQHSYPVQVYGLTDVADVGVADVAAGDYHSLAVKNDGTVWAWGDNYYGKLGVGDTTDRDAPVQVHGPNNVGYLTDIGAPAAGTPPPGENPPDEHPPDVAICHKAETPQAKTFYVPSSKAERLLNKKGYTEGACEE